MCVMWSTADQYSEFEECTQTDQNFEIAGHDTLRFITVNPDTYVDSHRQWYILFAVGAVVIFFFAVGIREFPYYFDFTLSQTGRKNCDARSISLNMGSQV